MAEDKLQKVFGDLPFKVSLSFASCEPADPLPEPSDSETVVVDIDPPVPKKVALVLKFSEPGFGFGEVTIVQTSEGVFIDTEYMKSEHVKKYLCMLVDQAILDYDRDPERHALYKKVMGQVCGPACPVCKGV